MRRPLLPNGELTLEPRRAFASALAILLLACTRAAAPPASAADAEACLQQSHRFEAFALPAPVLGRDKRILVYLPPGYDCDPKRRYPVFYFNDGHDLFDWSPPPPGLGPEVAAEIARREGWYGSWRLGAQLTAAARAGRLPPMILVGIASDDGFRSTDLVPVPWGGASEGRGIAYGAFLAGTLLPEIERRYRTHRNRACRGVAGASLGGVSALQIGLAHGRSFGLVLALSPVLADPAIAAYLEAAWSGAAPAPPTAFLLDFDEDPAGAADLARFRKIAAGNPDRAAILQRSPGGRHRLASWSERVIPALARLIGGDCP